MNGNLLRPGTGRIAGAALAGLLLASSAFPRTAANSRPAPGRELATLRASAENRYTLVPLVSDGFDPAPDEDLNLVNPWGLTRAPAGPWWVADNGTDRATLYSGDGVANPLVVSLPAGAAPTGVVFNERQGFPVSDGVDTWPALFIFAGEEGRIFAWHPAVPPPAPSPTAFLVHDDSGTGAIYKGITLASTAGGDRLYVTDFHNRRVEVLDELFHPVPLPAGAFLDPRVPQSFAPFGIQNLQGRIFVTYAQRDDEGEDDVAGPGLGYVSAFDLDGRFLARVGTRGLLNSPWGLALAPEGFGPFGGDLLVGNFGSGTILAYRLTDDMRKATLAGVLRGTDGRALVIEGLWSLGFGNNLGAGSSEDLFFTAGPDDENHGLFGRIEAHP